MHNLPFRPGRQKEEDLTRCGTGGGLYRYISMNESGNGMVSAENINLFFYHLVDLFLVFTVKLIRVQGEIPLVNYKKKKLQRIRQELRNYKTTRFTNTVRNRQTP